MNRTLRDALIATVCYADIFDYPLKKEEVRTWAPFCVIRPPLALRLAQGKLQAVALRKFRRIRADGEVYYSIRFGKRLIQVRNQRAACSVEKWNRARRVARLLRIIPTIQLVGITGGLAMNNASDDDDIDVFIVALPRTLWITRLLATILTDALGVRRHPNDRMITNKICLNMFVTRDALAVPKNERDLFTAHEVLQMIPLWNRNNIYQQFLQANRWVKTFLPNGWKQRFQAPSTKLQIISKSKIQYFIFRYCLGFVIWSLKFTEVPARVIQLWYMRKRHSTEVVSDKVIRFHPRDARVWIRNELTRRLTRFNIPLDKIFYGR